MTSLAFVIATATLLVPREYHIDCSGWHGKTLNEFGVLITSMDGKTLKTKLLLDTGADPEVARDLLWSLLERNGWRGRTESDTIIILEGSKKSSIRSVKFISTGWKPDVRVVLTVPPKK